MKEYSIEEAEENFDNRDFMQQAIRDNACWVYAYASDKLHDDRDLMLEAVKIDGQSLYYASENLRDDKEVVLEAVKNKGLIYKYASLRLRNDKEIAITAIKQSSMVIPFISESIKEDEEIKELISPKEES